MNTKDKKALKKKIALIIHFPPNLSEKQKEAGTEVVLNLFISEIAAREERLVEEIKKFECECTCGCNFKPGSGCLCIGDRDGFNTAKIRIINLIKSNE